jgi:hypothetical protein
MSHYDYLSPHMAGLAGPVEDLASVAVKSVATQVGNNREAAWNYFRFGISDISASTAEGRIKGWTKLTPAFKAAMDALKPFMFPLATFTDLKDFKLEDRIRLQADLKTKFDAEWAKAFPSSAASAPSAAPASRFGLNIKRMALPIGPIGPLVRAGADTGASIRTQGAGTGAETGGGGDGDAKFPIVPVAIGAAALVAFFLLARR